MYARTATVLLALVVLGVPVAGAHAAEPGAAVSCDRIALTARSGAAEGYRVLLQSVAIPGVRQLAAATAARPRGHWRYYRHAGVAVRAGTSGVSVSVPAGWRDRVALSWGGSSPASAVRFPACSASPGRVWNSFSGGILLSGRADCVPLLVTVGGMSTSVRVGVGRACGRL